MTSHRVVLLALLLHTGCAGPRFDLRRAPEGRVDGPAAHVLGIVRIKAPWYAPRFVIARRFREAVPEYEALAALSAKYFTISDDREFGGVYLWQSRADAEAFYSPAWRQGIRDRRGQDPDLLVLDAPFVVRGRAGIDGDLLGTRAMSYPATVTLALWSTASAGDTQQDLARRLADDAKDRVGLVRAVVVVGPGRVGLMALWATRELAAGAGRDVLGLGEPALTLFDAPVLIDASLRAP